MAYTDLRFSAARHIDDALRTHIADFCKKSPDNTASYIALLVKSIEGSPDMERILGTIFFTIRPNEPYAAFGGQIIAGGPIDTLREKELLWIESSLDKKSHLVGPTNKMFDEFKRLESTAAAEALRGRFVPGILAQTLHF
ncbi:MAG: hypothetical protein WC464_01215 [Bdellovibrionales bacterium]